MNENVLVEFSRDQLRFIVWAMQFLEGGLDAEDEPQRDAMEFKFRKALSDQEDGVIYRASGGPFSIECAFCEGGGAFPDILSSDEIVTEPCPVCNGKGFNVFRTGPANILKCRFCGGDGKAWDSSGYRTGDICQVCHGTGAVLLEPIPDGTANDFLWMLIHPDIEAVSRTRFESGHYADSTEAAFKQINSVVKQIVRSDTGEDVDGAALMYKAFSPKQPVICLGDLSTESGRNVQQGYMQIYAGAMTGIRNLEAHENVEIDSSRASHFLVLASLLMSKLEETI